MDNNNDTNKLLFDFFCNVKTGDEIGFYHSLNRIKINLYKQLKGFTIEHASVQKEVIVTKRIRVVFAFGNWYTGLKSHGRSQSEKMFNSICRDVEGEIVMNLLNANNPFHEQTQIFKIAKNIN